SRSDTIGVYTETLNNDELGEFEFFGSDAGNTLSEIAAAVRIYQDGAAGASRVPTRFEWQTGTAIADAATKMSLNSAGTLALVKTSNQLVLGTTNTMTLNAVAPSSSRVIS